MCEITHRAALTLSLPHIFQMWNSLPADQKKPYYDEAENIKQQHRMDYPGEVGGGGGGYRTWTRPDREALRIECITGLAALSANLEYLHNY